MQLRDKVIAHHPKVGEVRGRIWSMPYDGAVFEVLPDGEMSLKKAVRVAADSVRAG